MYSIVTTAVLHGLDAVLVQVEADVSPGLPAFEMVGFLSSEVKEAKERVRTALKNCGYPIPAKRITISFSPAGIRKSGSGFDLAIAIAILTALEILPRKKTEGILFLGELNLSGRILPIHGVLPMLAKGAEEGYTMGVTAKDNRQEAALVWGMKTIGVEHLKQAVEVLREGEIENVPNNIEETGAVLSKIPDFSEISGQKVLKRACEIAVAGRHNLLMVGPPGAGKTMAAKRIPGILPPMTEEERLQVTKIYSICGLFDEKKGLIKERPFRSPHHTVTPQGLCGGGSYPRPGEISLAHGGVLFLDELAEFKSKTLETLRQPMEEKQVQLIRTHGKYTFPADFMLVAAMNPCACGNYPDMQKCRCSEAELRRYKNRISRPLLDRMDLCIKIDKIPYKELCKRGGEETSAQMRERVLKAHRRQAERYRKEEYSYNSQIPAKEIRTFCGISKKQEEELQGAYENLNLSARAFHKILKTARTIADLEESEKIQSSHLREALCYRAIDREFWERRL